MGDLEAKLEAGEYNTITVQQVCLTPRFYRPSSVVCSMLYSVGPSQRRVICLNKNNQPGREGSGVYRHQREAFNPSEEERRSTRP